MKVVPSAYGLEEAHDGVSVADRAKALLRTDGDDTIRPVFVSSPVSNFF